MVSTNWPCPLKTFIFICILLEIEIAISFEELNGFGSFNNPGGVIILEHKLCDGSKFYALYGHLNRQINYSQKIKQGNIIGTLIKYETNNFRADHLHFGIWMNEKLPHSPYGYDTLFRFWVDPINFINSRK